MRIFIKELPKLIGKEVKLYGFVSKIRDQKTMQFIIMRDSTGLVQLTNHKKSNVDLANIISSLTVESSIRVIGNVVKADNVKLGGLEVVIKEIHIENMSYPELPIENNSALDKRMDYRFLSMRDPKTMLIFQIQTTMEHAMREYWIKRKFTEIHSPKLMGVPSESGAELFELNYFNNKTAYLAQSPQFYKQMAIAAGCDGVFEIGPVFRANPSFTSRHDTEFTSVDVEIAWIESYDDIMKFEEKWIVHLLQSIKNVHGTKIKELYDIDIVIPTLPFPKISMKEARKILDELGHVISEKDDMDPEGERLLAKYVKETFNHDFVFVTEYPSSVRPFYHMRNKFDNTVTNSYDLLWKGLEITTGAQREHNYDILVNQAKEKGLSLNNMQSYLDCFKYGCPAHGGFGFGLTRSLMLLLNYKNVREVTYLYRGPNRLTP